MNPLDPTLVEIFSVEQTEHVLRIRALVEALRAGPRESHGAAFDEALRRAHTLKGAARAVGLEQTELLAHRIEALLLKARQNVLLLDGEMAAALHRLLDGAEDVLAFALGKRSEPDLSGVLADAARLAGAPQLEDRPATSAAASAPEPLSSAAGGDLVRVNAHYIDDLIRSSSQLLAATAAESTAEGQTSRADETLQEWQRLRRNSADCVRRMREDPVFEPVLACLGYVDDHLRALAASARSSASAERHRKQELRQRSAELHRQALQVRMTSAESVFGSFGAMVRELAEAEQKAVEFRAEGLEVQADRVVLQALKDPVMHLLRNAISHGIEPAWEREATGKPAAGSVKLKIEASGNRLHLVVEDDGRGINLRDVAREAERQGLIPQGAGAESEQSREELKKLIFRPGFSTAHSLTRVAGRGLGLSVVEQAVTRLQGDVRVVPAGGGGTAVAISVGLSISTQHVLLLAAGGQSFGLSTSFVRRLCKWKRKDFENFNGGPAMRLDGEPVALGELAGLLDLSGAASEGHAGEDTVLVAVIESGGQKLGLIVDGFLDDREAVIKDSGLYDTEAGLSTGGVPLEDGTVAVILNVAGLLERFFERGAVTALQVPDEEAPKATPRILVVDDSITTRSLEKSILEAHGYSVTVAVDGAEALEKLREERADLVITDLMMPRLTGLQLLEKMKSVKELAGIPVIIVSSVENREDQERGLSLGADAYIVKRKFDQRELLQIVRQIL